MTHNHELENAAAELNDGWKPSDPTPSQFTESCGEYFTDCDPDASELWVVAGPEPYTGNPQVLADGFRFITDDEWEQFGLADADWK